MNYFLGGFGKDLKRMKMSQILDQADESELPPLTNDDQRAFRRLLRQKKGGKSAQTKNQQVTRLQR